MIFFCTILSLALVSVSSKDIDVCSSQFVIEGDLDEADCPIGQQNFTLSVIGRNTCFKKCEEVIPYADLGTKTCDITHCPKGYICDSVTFKCTLDETSCFKYHYGDSKNPWLAASLKPLCTPDGKYEAKQCKGEEANGRCFCYDEDGNKLFGQEWSNQAQDMTCACSKRRSELLKDPDTKYITLHCDRRGSFEPLQCISGECWCVEPLTGKLNSTFVPEKMITFLPCYDKVLVGDKYMRKCDSFAYAIYKITEEFLIHGTNFPNLPRITCDVDGAYGSIQIESGNAYCTWRDNTKIGSWQTNVADIRNMNCNCARDTKYFEENGKSLHLSCAPNGNYNPAQQTDDGQYYCVDSDGFKKSGFMDHLPTDVECDAFRSF